MTGGQAGLVTTCQHLEYNRYPGSRKRWHVLETKQPFQGGRITHCVCAVHNVRTGTNPSWIVLPSIPNDVPCCMCCMRSKGSMIVLDNIGQPLRDLVVYVVIGVIFFFAVNARNKKTVTSCNFFFFAVSRVSRLTRLTAKKNKITRRDGFFVTRIYSKIKNYTTGRFFRTRVYRKSKKITRPYHKEAITNFTENACMSAMCPPTCGHVVAARPM